MLSRRKLNSQALTFLCIFALAFLAVLINNAILWRFGELNTPETIATKQQAQNLLYGGLKHPLGTVKIASARARQAKILVLGTSRAMQLRHQAFSLPFYTYGGLANGPEQALSLWHSGGISDQRPLLTILVADWWAYGEPSRVAETLRPTQPIPFDGQLSGGRADFLIWELTTSGQFTFDAILSAAISPKAQTIGLTTALGGNGFRPDGSLCYLGLGDPSWEANLLTHGLRLRPAQYRPSLAVSQSAMLALEKLKEDIERQGSEFLIIAPPIAPIAYQMAATDPRFDWIQAWRREMTSRFGSNFIDTHDPRGLGASNLEFYDDIHPGETAMLRVLDFTLRSRPDLSGFFNLKAIKEGLENNASSIFIEEFETVKCHLPNATQRP